MTCNTISFAKFRIAKTSQEWKKEKEQCKYMPGSSTLPMINTFQLICGKLQWPLPVQIEKFVRILPMNLRQFVVSRAHLTFAEVAVSVKTYKELIEVDTVSHLFKNASFEDVGCTFCHKPHKSLECPSVRTLIEMEVFSSITPTDFSLSSSDSHSGSPTHEYGPCRQKYYDRSHSQSRSPNRYDSGYVPRYINSDLRDYYSKPHNRNGYFRNRCASPRYFNNGYDRLNSGPSQQWQGQGCNQDSYQGNNNNYGPLVYGKSQYNQCCRKGQNRGYRQYDNYPKQNVNNGHQSQSYGGNCQSQHQYFNPNPTSLSNLYSFVTQDGVTFHARRNQVFQNACTEE